MYPPITLDIDRLHRCVEAINNRKFLGRGEGRTTAILHLLVGELELCDPYLTYIVVVPTSAMVPYMLRILVPMLEEVGIELTLCSKERIVVNGYVQVRFMSAHTFYQTEATRGFRVAKVFWDAEHAALDNIDFAFIEYRHHMFKCLGVPFVGC